MGTDGMPPTIIARHCRRPPSSVTTKQARFTEQLLREMAGLPFPPERIYSQTVSGEPKARRLEQIERDHPGLTYHFVEDKYSTLEKASWRGCFLAQLLMLACSAASAGVTDAANRSLLTRQVCKEPHLAHWKLYLVDWGYNTPEERTRAAANPRVQVINAQEFGALLRNGSLAQAPAAI